MNGRTVRGQMLMANAGRRLLGTLLKLQLLKVQRCK